MEESRGEVSELVRDKEARMGGKECWIISREKIRRGLVDEPSLKRTGL
jgi:hypothetical protein